MKNKIFGIAYSIQKKEVETYCFHKCGQVLFGALVDKQLGELAPCKEEKCPFEEKRMKLGTSREGIVWLRKLKPLR